MKTIDFMYQTMLAELGQRSLDAARAADFPPDGRFTPVTVKERRYWYFDQPDGEGGRARRYVGPADDPEISARVETFKELKDDLRARRRLVSSLTREGGMIAADRMTGDIVEALAAAGLFRLRAVLIGTVAFQTYAGVLGVRLPMASVLTGDADIAQDYAISAEVGDTLPPITEILQEIDPTFRPVPHVPGSLASSAFTTASRRRPDGLSALKREKDIKQAELLFEALKITRRASDLALAYEEAWGRGAGWQEAIKAGRRMLSKSGGFALTSTLRIGRREIGGGDEESEELPDE